MINKYLRFSKKLQLSGSTRIAAVEMTIVRVTRDIKKRQGNTGSDKLNSLSKLVNAYNRLVERTKEDTESDSEPSDVNYYEKMEKECFGDVAVR